MLRALDMALWYEKQSMVQDGRVVGVFGDLLGEFYVDTRKRQIKNHQSHSESYYNGIT